MGKKKHKEEKLTCENCGGMYFGELLVPDLPAFEEIRSNRTLNLRAVAKIAAIKSREEKQFHAVVDCNGCGTRHKVTHWKEGVAL